MTITFLQPDGVAITAQAFRQGQAATHGGGAGRPLGGRSGFRVDTASNILTATATTWTLVPCSAMIDPGATTHQGMYGWASDANVTGAVTAADATYTRKDIVYIKVNDSSAGDGSGALSAPVEYRAGTASADPEATKAVLQAREFLVGTITVPQSGGGSPTVVLNPARFVAAGGILPVFSLAERDALTTHDGLTVRRMDISGRPSETWDGSVWRPATGNAPFGHMGRTAGNFSLTTTNATVTMDAAQELRGGMTFDNATDSLVIPVTGLYRVTMRLYTTGSATGKHTCIASKVGAGGAAIPGCAVQVNKSDTTDWFGGSTVTVPLTAGDKLYVAAAAASASNTWGTDGYNGTFLELQYIGA